jgi:CheY-like chemotaxis protein
MTALIVDADTYSVEVVAKMLRGFGIDAKLSASSEQEGWRLLDEHQSIDLVICDSSLASPVGGNFVEQLRRSDSPNRKYVPVIVLSAHSDKGNVIAARDSGANNVIRKPVSATTLYDRVVWAVSNGRKFVETSTYIGPDRRFRNIGPPDGAGRRSTDLSVAVGEASEPNLSQGEIDSFMTPMKIKID